MNNKKKIQKHVLARQNRFWTFKSLNWECIRKQNRYSFSLKSFISVVDNSSILSFDFIKKA